MRVQLAVLVDDVGVALDIRYEQLRPACKGRMDSIDCPVPFGWRLLRHVALGNLVPPRFEVGLQARIVIQVHKPTLFGKWIDDA
jgi:hypothetical protein